MITAGAIVALVGFTLLAPLPTQQQWDAALYFAGFGVLAAALSYQTSGSTTGTIAFLPALSFAVLSPNVASLVAVVISSGVGELVARRAAIKAVFNISQNVVAVGAASAVYLLLGGTSLLEARLGILPLLGLGVVYFSANKLAVSTVVALTANSSIWAHWLRSMRGSVVYDVLSFPLVPAFAIAYSNFGPGWSAMLALPILGIRQLYRTLFALQKVNEELLQLMVASIEARDPYTSGHSQRVSTYSKVIARAAGLNEKQVGRAAVAALLHDVGKIHEEFATILRKPGALTDEEFRVMKTHPVKSAELVAKVSQFSDLVPSVRGHHEAWDGSGYPDAKRGEAIPVLARIVALADTIDAMTTSRPYRNGLSVDQVRAEIARVAGSQFDPTIASQLLQPENWTALVRELALAQREHPAIAPLKVMKPHESIKPQAEVAVS